MPRKNKEARKQYEKERWQNLKNDMPYRSASTERSVRWAKEHPERHHANYRSWLLRHRGLTNEQHQKLLDAQGGVCAICGKPETRCYKGKVTTLVIDHDHKTGVVRGLLCHACNAGLGLFGDSVLNLRTAAAYLERF